MSRNYGLLFSKGFYREIENNTIIQYDHYTDSRKVNKVQMLLAAAPFSPQDELSWLTCPYDMSELRKNKKVKDEKETVDVSKLYGMFKTSSQKPKNQKKTSHDAENEVTESSIMARNGIVALEMKVLYPGLYSAMSVDHGVGDVQSSDQNNQTDFNTGFSFDYTTGLPYIPGSSVKGALRACFIDHADDVLRALNSTKKDKYTQQIVSELELFLFGSRVSGNGTDEYDGNMGNVIFYDAFPVSDSNTPGAVLAEDYITPHPDPLRSPGPIIHTVKIKPGTTIRFCFKIPENEQGSVFRDISADRIVKMFRILLNLWGIGAKTNWGYGSLR